MTELNFPFNILFQDTLSAIGHGQKQQNTHLEVKVPCDSTLYD